MFLLDTNIAFAAVHQAHEHHSIVEYIGKTAGHRAAFDDYLVQTAMPRDVS